MLVACRPLNVRRLTTIALVMVIQGGILLATHGQETDPDVVLQKMAAFDNIYQTTLTATGQMVEPAPQNASFLGPTNKNFTLTWDGERKSLIERIFDPDLAYQRPSEFPNNGVDLPGISFDKNGDLIKSFQSYKAVSMEPDRSSWVEVSTVYRITPGGTVVDEGDDRAVMKHTPDDPSLTFPMTRNFWAMGRGYSENLTGKLSVDSDVKGRLRIKGSGSGLFDQQQGRWEIEVDPAAQYLVTKAVFYTPADSPSPYLTVTNDDPVIQDEFVFPKHATVIMHRLGDAEFSFTFVDVSFSSDQAVIDEARRETDDHSTPRTLILDGSVTPSTSKYINRHGNASETRAPVESKNRFRFWIVAGILATIAVGYLAIRRLQK